MSPLFIYFIKVIICSGMLFLYYQVALRNRLFHQWNRFYLLAAVCISLAAPLLPFSYTITEEKTGPIVQVLQVVQAAGGEEENISGVTKAPLSIQNLFPYAYAIVSGMLLFAIIRGLWQLYRLKKSHTVQQLQHISFIQTDVAGTPYSFFRYIFWNNAIALSSPSGQQIFRHEMVHVREGHSFDKLFLQLVLVFAWINPFFWIIRRELGIIHEFIADRGASEKGDVHALASAILQSACPAGFHNLTHSFFQSPIKRRLLMMAKLQNPRMNYLGRIIALPVIAASVFTFALKAQTIPIAKLDKTFTVVLDAGHGYVNGTASGARSGAITEDDVVLQLARIISEKNKNPQMRIVLSRKDKEVTSLSDRVNAAKAANADLFLSLHMDAAKEASGLRIYIGKDNNAFQEQSRRIGSLLQKELSTVYTTSPQLLQRQMTLYVLDKNIVPSVMLELGSILNAADRDFMTSTINMGILAERILTALEAYAVQEQSAKNGLSITGQFHSFTDTGGVHHVRDFEFSFKGLEDEENPLPMLLVEGKKVDPSLFEGKIIKGNYMMGYASNDPKAIALYGPEARYGVMVFGKITVEPMRKPQPE